MAAWILPGEGKELQARQWITHLLTCVVHRLYISSMRRWQSAIKNKTVLPGFWVPLNLPLASGQQFAALSQFPGSSLPSYEDSRRAGTVAGTWRSCQKCLKATYSCQSAICADGRDKLYFVKYISERQRLWKFNLLLNNFPQDGHQELMVTEHGIVVIVPVKARLYFQRVLIPRKFEEQQIRKSSCVEEFESRAKKFSFTWWFK